jgi:hypothetical protein
MIGSIVQDVRMNKMVKTENRYISLNVGQVGHYWKPKIHGNPSDHGGTHDGSRHFMHIFKVVDNVGYRRMQFCRGKECEQPLEFEVGDHVYLRVSPMKGVKRFGVKGKLAPRYIRPFPILEKCGMMVYKLDLPPSLAGVHDIFHVSQVKKCLKAPVDVMLPKVKPLKANLSYPEHPIKVLDQKDRVTRCKTIKFFKI